MVLCCLALTTLDVVVWYFIANIPSHTGRPTITQPELLTAIEKGESVQRLRICLTQLDDSPGTFTLAFLSDLSFAELDHSKSE
jgi:hypothetical protein